MVTKKITLNELRSIVKQIIKEELNFEPQISEFLNIINDDSSHITPVGGDNSIVRNYDQKNNIINGEFDFIYLKDDGDEEIIDDIPFEAKIFEDNVSFQSAGSAPDEWGTKKYYYLGITVGGKNLFDLLNKANKKDTGSTYRSIRDEIYTSVTHFIRTKTNNKRFKITVGSISRIH